VEEVAQHDNRKFGGLTTDSNARPLKLAEDASFAAATDFGELTEGVLAVYGCGVPAQRAGRQSPIWGIRRIAQPSSHRETYTVR
jgi:hypothetical protein